MIDKEKLIEIKNNLEEQAVICSEAVEDAWSEKEEMRKRYDRIIENALFNKKKNEVLLALVNNELRAMEEVEKIMSEPWREALANKALDDFHQAHQPWRKEMDGLTDHMVKDKEYSFEEFGDQVLDRYTEASERVNASARRAEEKESVEASAKDKGRDRSFASFLAKYWIGNKEDEEGTAGVSLDTFNQVIEKLVNTKPESYKDESKENLSSENTKNVTKSLKSPSEDSVTEENTKVSKKSKSYDTVTTKIKEGKALDQSEINTLFKPCYEIECAIVDILKKYKTLKLKDIVYFVEQKDLDFESKHIYGFVQSVLNRSERFEKVSYGNWRLKKEEGETGDTKPDSNKEVESIAESTVLSVVRPKWNGVISYVDKLGVVNKIEQK
jgi:hypothetical protein